MKDLARQGHVDLFFGDESHFCSEGYVPRGWQFRDEKVAILVEKGFKINCFAMINAKNDCHYTTTLANINGQFIVNVLDKFAETVTKETFLVLDNASIHKSKLVKAQLERWQESGLFIFFIPPYCPELNIAETLWRMLKTLEIRPQDYKDQDTLFARLTERLDSLGEKWRIFFSNP